MPRVKMSDECLICLESRQFADEMCPTGCINGLELEAIFNMCYNQNTDEPCRHIKACGADPRTCKYWPHVEYPREVQ